MPSPLDVATEIVEKARRDAVRGAALTTDPRRAVYRNRKLFADGTVTVLRCEDGPDLAKRMDVRFDYNDGMESLVLTLRDDQAYKIQRAKELTARVHLNVRLALWLNSSNEWMLISSVIYDRWTR